jgi:multidrug resistance efflux pump
VKKQKMITDRADRAEEALMNAEREGANNSEATKQMRAEVAAARKELENAKIEREAAEEGVSKRRIGSRRDNRLNATARGA